MSDIALKLFIKNFHSGWHVLPLGWSCKRNINHIKKKEMTLDEQSKTLKSMYIKIEKEIENRQNKILKIISRGKS